MRNVGQKKKNSSGPTHDSDCAKVHAGTLGALTEAGVSLTIPACGSGSLQVIIKHEPHSGFVTGLI